MPAQTDDGSVVGARQVRSDFVTWFGLPGHAVVRSNGWHVVRVGFVTVPHLGLVNRLLRGKDPSGEWLRLVGLHERGHFETLPVAVALLGGLLLSERRPRPGTPAMLLAAAIFSHIAWEGLAEGWSMKEMGAEHQWPPFGRTAAFWLGVAVSCSWLVGSALGRARQYFSHSAPVASDSPCW